MRRAFLGLGLIWLLCIIAVPVAAQTVVNGDAESGNWTGFPLRLYPGTISEFVYNLTLNGGGQTTVPAHGDSNSMRIVTGQDNFFGIFGGGATTITAVNTEGQLPPPLTAWVYIPSSNTINMGIALGVDTNDDGDISFPGESQNFIDFDSYPLMPKDTWQQFQLFSPISLDVAAGNDGEVLVGAHSFGLGTSGQVVFVDDIEFGTAPTETTLLNPGCELGLWPRETIELSGAEIPNMRAAWVDSSIVLPQEGSWCTRLRSNFDNYMGGLTWLRGIDPAGETLGEFSIHVRVPASVAGNGQTGPRMYLLVDQGADGVLNRLADVANGRADDTVAQINNLDAAPGFVRDRWTKLTFDLSGVSIGPNPGYASVGVLFEVGDRDLYDIYIDGAAIAPAEIVAGSEGWQFYR